MEKNILLEVKNLFKTYWKNPILENLNFDIKENEIIGILGLSGSGKSTLLQILCGISDANFGEVNYFLEDGKKIDILKHTNNKVKSFIGYSVQESSFYNELTVLQNLTYFGNFFNLSQLKLEEVISKLLKSFKLEEVKNLISKDLSGGLKKRLDICCALIGTPKILILDEPTESLDFELREDLFFLLKELRKLGITIIFISHLLTEVEKVCDRVLILNNKRITKLESIKNLKNNFMEVLRK